MEPMQHPNEDIIARFAAATLSEGAYLVIGVHMALCKRCRALARTFEVVGGALLDGLEPTAMAPDAYAKALQRVTGREEMVPAGADVEILPGLPMPIALRGCRIGRWRSLGPGLKFSRITPRANSTMNVFMLRAAPGTSLLEHGHSGNEYLCVLKGSFADQGGRHQAGDMVIADADVEHRPIVDDNGECICIVALEGKLRLRSLIGRLVQPVYGL